MKLLSHHVLRDHVLIGGIAALALMPCWGWQGSLLFWLANVFIDADHYLHFLYARRQDPWHAKGAKGMFAYHQALFDQVRRPDFLALEIFHTAEFLLLTACLGFSLPALLPIFWGCVFHSAVDWVHLGRQGLLLKRVNSILEYAIRRRKMLSQGLDTGWVMGGGPNAPGAAERKSSTPPKTPPR